MDDRLEQVIVSGYGLLVFFDGGTDFLSGAVGVTGDVGVIGAVGVIGSVGPNGSLGSTTIGSSGIVIGGSGFWGGFVGDRGTDLVSLELLMVSSSFLLVRNGMRGFTNLPMIVARTCALSPTCFRQDPSVSHPSSHYTCAHILTSVSSQAILPS